jgi:hypothetical protein
MLIELAVGDLFRGLDDEIAFVLREQTQITVGEGAGAFFRRP